MAKRRRRRQPTKFSKKRAYSSRNFNDPVYKAWRQKVRARDGNKCQWAGCKCRTKLQTHHIMKWSDYPHLRFEISNGITLCRRHHDGIKGKEDDFVRLFSTILLNKLREKMRDKKHNYKDVEDD